MKNRIGKVSAIRRIAVIGLSALILAAFVTGCGNQAGTTEQNPAGDAATEVAADGSGDSGTGNKTVITPPVKDENVIEHWINNEGYVVTVDVNHDDYKTAQDPVDAPEKFNGDMRVSNTLSAFDPKCGEKELNHPNCIATDGTHFALCDTWNNRVLIWNSLPTGNVKADVVLGQKDFESFDAGIGMNQLNWPVGITFAGEKMIVADTHNNRLLVYDKVPTENGATADHVITAISSEDDLMWPWAVWSDGSRLIATSTEVGKVAFWDDLDSAISGGYADHIVNTGGTPRCIVTDGDYLLIADHNMGWSADGYDLGKQGSHIWLTYPTDGRDPDLQVDMELDGAIIDGDLYLLSQKDETMHIYDGLIDSVDKKSAITFDNKFELFRNGDHGSMVYVDGRTYVCYYNSGFVAIYDGKITEDNYMSPMGFIGADENVRSMSVLRGQYQNTVPASDGTSLVFIDDFDGLIGIYKTIPDTFDAIPDFLYHFPPEWDSPIDVVVDKYGRMLVLTDSSLLIWNHIPLSGELYDNRIEFEHCIGGTRSKIEACDEGFILFSENDEKIYKLPLSNEARSFDNAINQVDAKYVSGLSCDGTYLSVVVEEDQKVDIYNVSDLSLYGEIYSDTHINREGFYPVFEVVKEAIHLPNGQYLVADQNMIRVWDSLDEAIADREFDKCEYMGRLDNYPVKSKYGGIIRDEFHNMATDGTLFKPTYMAYSHGHLWVGEFKFSSRLLRYDIKYDGEEEAPAEPAEADDTGETEVSKGSSEYDALVSQTIDNNGTITLSSPANATVKVELYKDFTVDCAGQDLTIKGKIILHPSDNTTMTIINPGKLDLSGLAFEKPSDVSVGGDTDYLVVIKGENLDIIPPSDVPEGSRKERTKGFFYEPKSSSAAIRYGGQ